MVKSGEVSLKVSVVFRGINVVNIDSKGRLAIPARYRSYLQEEGEAAVILTIDPEARCLMLYPCAAWEIIEQKIESLPSFNAMARRVQRLLIGHATELELDSQGRILVPALLREYAHLNEKIVLIGQGKKFELWDEAAWDLHREQWLGEMQQPGGALPPELSVLSL